MTTMMPVSTVSTALGYEILGKAKPLSIFPQVHWQLTEAYDYIQGHYGLLVHESDGTAIAFLSTQAELDALSARIEFCLTTLALAYWPAFPKNLLEEWRTLWWMIQTFMAHQRLRGEN